RLTLETDLPGTIRHGDLSLVYQPIFDLDTGRLEGVEALLRWSHPDRGPIPPDVFIPLAESTGQIIPMGRWVLREACEQVQMWRSEYPGCADLGLSVNLSTRQLTDPILVDTVRTTLNATGIPPRQLTLEITETALLQDVASTLPALEALAALGVRLALDDFGTGYSSLSYLRRMPVHTIKIDRSFAEGVASGSTESTLVNLIVDLSRGLGLDTVAEGIETAEQHAELRALGCTRGQGFLLGRPAPPEAIVALLARRTVANAGPFTIQTAPVPVRERFDRLVGPTL
ncbi:MAG: putative bifunctional diguanylate cyclase/phosphodiesterase, partial [Actinomycetes bacterium]